MVKKGFCLNFEHKKGLSSSQVRQRRSLKGAQGPGTPGKIFGPHLENSVPYQYKVYALHFRYFTIDFWVVYTYRFYFTLLLLNFVYSIYQFISLIFRI